MSARRPAASVLAVDVGGSGIKAALISREGRIASRMLRIPTPRPATPERVLAAIVGLARALPGFARAGVGFPGVVRGGVVWTAPNLAPRTWTKIPLEARLRTVLACPVRVANDAVVHGLGAVRGRGVELMLTLGTGLGGALFVEGRPLPLEPGHLPWRGGRTFEHWIGEAGRRRLGTPRWRRHVARVVQILSAALQPRRIVLGGGNARRLRLAAASGLARADNRAGLRGVARLLDLPPAVRGRATQRARKMKNTAPAMQSAAQR
jgi:polyphosphate glucokinase